MRQILNNLSELIDRFTSVPLFVITGAPKSGTTWVHKLCSSHPELHCQGEDDFNRLLKNFADAMNDYNSHSAARNTQLPHSAYSNFAQGDMETLIATAMAMMIGKHIDPGTTKAIGTKFNDLITNNTAFFAQMFRDVPVICVMRDPRDTLVSIHHNNQRINPELSAQQFPNLVDTIRHLGPVLRETLANADVVRDANAETFQEVRYEDFQADGPGTMTRVCTFLGVDAAPATVTACLEAASFEKMSGGRQSGTEDTASFMRKGIVGDWRDKMDDACLQALTETGLADVIAERGYAD